MTQVLDVYRCDICDNMVEVIRAGAGELVCCEQPMTKLDAKTADQGREKHAPVVEKTAAGWKVKVGSIPHPMEEKHFIEWIEVLADGKAYRQFLKPGAAPEAVFEIAASEITAREHCNLHGMWKGV